MAVGCLVVYSSKNRAADDTQEATEGLIGNSCDTVGSPPSPGATLFLRKRDGPCAGCNDVRQISSVDGRCLLNAMGCHP